MKKSRKKNFLSGTFALLLAAIMLAALPTEAEAEIYDDTLRLHILANSDSEEDQELKIKIRDKILIKYGSELRAYEFDEAITKAEELLFEIEKDVNLWLNEFDAEYHAKATFTEEWYDTRVYEGFSLPAGRYMSLRVILGEGCGKNWWCVMYPPLCMDIATERAPTDDGIIDYSKEEVNLIKGGKYNIKFKLLETFNAFFNKKG